MMCDLCSREDSVRARARSDYLHMADRLEALAGSYRRLALGVTKPHSASAEDLGHLARHIIKKLVQEWL